MASGREEEVRRFAEADNRGDLDALAEWADPGLEWVTAREHPSAASHRGIEAIRAYHEDWLRLFPGLRIELESVEERGDRVLAVARSGGQARAAVRRPRSGWGSSAPIAATAPSASRSSSIRRRRSRRWPGPGHREMGRMAAARRNNMSRPVHFRQDERE